MKITIDSQYPLELYREAGKLTINPDAEEYLIKLLELQKIVDEAVSNAKKAIQEMGEQFDDGFKGVVGAKINVVNSLTGYLYAYDPALVEVARPFLKERIYLNPDSAKISNYFKEYGKLPPGILENPRNKSIKFYVKKI